MVPYPPSAVDPAARRVFLARMSDPGASHRPLPHTVGEAYAFDEVRAALGGDPKPPNFVIHRDGAVVGVCLGTAWNPRAEADPCEVWVGRKGNQPQWGIKLAETRGPLPVYVRRTEGGVLVLPGPVPGRGADHRPA